MATSQGRETPPEVSGDSLNQSKASTSAAADASTTALTQAVASLNLQANSRNVAAQTARDSGEPTGLQETDSGKPTGSQETDSGYQSMEGSPLPKNFTNPRQGGYDLPSHTLMRRTATKLKQFGEELPEPMRNRFADLKELFGQPLYSFVIKKHSRISAISMKLKMLGVDERSAKPWIVVLCDKAIKNRVKQYFDQSHVKAHYEYPLFFKLLVYERSPTPMAATPANLIYAQYGICSTNSLTLCGKVIRVDTATTSRLATFGGIIKVVDAFQNARLYGMTAGHILFNGGEEWPEQDCASVRGDNEDDEAVWNESEVEFELDLGFDEDPPLYECELRSGSPHPLEQATQSRPSWSNMGRIVALSLDFESVRGNFDWALIEVDDPETWHPNSLMIDADHTRLREGGQPKNIQFIEGIHAELLQPKPVVLLGGVSGPRSGVLSPKTSFLMMAPGKSSTRTYTLAFDDQSVLQPGDCGSWVVDKATGILYGHVVASDIFGDAYVMPVEDTFQDIKKHLGFDSVSLPTVDDPLLGSAVSSGHVEHPKDHTHLPFPPTTNLGMVQMPATNPYAAGTSAYGAVTNPHGTVKNLFSNLTIYDHSSPIAGSKMPTDSGYSSWNGSPAPPTEYGGPPSREPAALTPAALIPAGWEPASLERPSWVSASLKPVSGEPASGEPASGEPASGEPASGYLPGKDPNPRGPGLWKTLRRLLHKKRDKAG